MENGLKLDSATVTKKHFAKINEKIQTKYEEMQRKLEKSKSIDMLDSVSSEFNFKDDRKYTSVHDLSKVDDDSDSVFTDEVVQNIRLPKNQKNMSLHQEIIYKEAIITKPDSLLTLSEKLDSEIEDNFENDLLKRCSFKTSIESLTEEKESDESNEPQTLTPKSIRHRIGSRIAAVRNRRREAKEKREKEKKITREKVEKFVLSNSTKFDITKSEKKVKIAVVTLALIEASGFQEDPEEKPRSLMCRFRVGTEKRKSKIVKSQRKIVKFQEIISFDLYDDDDYLEIILWDKDILIGRTTVDLSALEKEKTHTIRNVLDGDIPNIKIFTLLTISGTSMTNTLYDIDENKYSQMVETSKKKYNWYRLCDEFSNVGRLWVIVYGAKGLSGNDCYCVLNMNNESIRTATDYKTNTPSWMKIFSFIITDITSTLEIIVIDERKCEEVGKITIPLLNMEPNKKRWYTLKDFTERQTAKGQNPRILLEMNISWNLIKAAIKVINIKEPNYLQTDDKLDRHLFARNLSRAKSVISWTLNFLKIFKTCFQWESWKVNVAALVIWILFWTFGKIWMFPLLLLIPFAVYNYKKITFINWEYRLSRKIQTDSENDSKSDKDEKSVSLRQRINSWQEMIQLVQNSIGKFASIGESIKNLYNFSVPFISYLAILFIIVIALVMYLIPFNYICIFWGMHKFTQKILRPNRIPHNEIMDLINRVPDDEDLIKRQEIPLQDLSDEDE